MAKLNHKNLGEVQKTAYLTATITTVDGGNDTACFAGVGNCPSDSDIPIFYHCQYEEGEEPTKRSNGALEGASGAFSKDDEVIVQCEVLDSTTYKPLYVIGFVDKPKQCQWEPWNGPELDSRHPWVELLEKGQCSIEHTAEKGKFLEFTGGAPGGEYSLLWISEIPEKERPEIPKQELYFNILSTLSSLNHDSWMDFFLIDELGIRKEFVFAYDGGAGIPSGIPPWNNPIRIDDNEGKIPLDLAPLTGKIKAIQYEMHLTLMSDAFFQSEFIHFK